MLSHPLFSQFLALSCFVLFMGFCFCDGFQLHIVRKMVWFVVFIWICLFVFQMKNEFDVGLILPIPCLLAYLLCAFEKHLRKKSQQK